jgi:hypothetical protein
VSVPDRIGLLLLPRHTRHYFRRAEEAFGGHYDIKQVVVDIDVNIDDETEIE